MKIFSRKRKRQIVTKKKSFFERKKEAIEEDIELLAKINFNITFKQVKLVLGLLFFIGFFLGFFLGNFFLALVFGLSFPYFFIEWLNMKKSSIQLYIDAQVIKYASLIKNSYMGSYNIKQSIEYNLKMFEEPIKTLFENWVNDVSIYNYTYEEAFNKMNKQFKSKSLKELTDQLLMCDRDRTFKDSLEATVGHLQDKRDFMMKWDRMKKEITRMYVSFVFMILAMTAFILYGYADISKVFLDSWLSNYVFGFYFLIIILASVFVMKKINAVET